MLRPEHEQLLTTLLELRPDEPAVVVITSRRLTAGTEILDYLSSRFGFHAVDVFEEEPTLSGDPTSRRRFIHGLPFLSTPDRLRLLGELNRGRDRIETLSNQVVLWLYEDDRSEFFSAAPDLAAWVDEVLPWEGEIVEREVYSWRTRVPKDMERRLHERVHTDSTRGVDAVEVPLVLPRSVRSIAADRLAVFVYELATLGVTLRLLRSDESVEAFAAEACGTAVATPREEVSAAAVDLVFRSQDDGILFWAGASTGLSIHKELGAIVNLSQELEPALRVWSLNSDNLSHIVRTFTSTPASVVHYAGHSSGQGLAADGPDGSVLHPQALRRVLGGRSTPHPIKLLVLNTSNSASTARALVESPAVVSAVIAADVDLEDRVAVTFAQHFYEALLAGQPLRAALDSTNAALCAAEGAPRGWSPYKLWLSGS